MNSKRWRLHIWHAYSINEALSNDHKVEELVNLILTFVLKIAFLDFVAIGAIVFHKHMHFNILQTSYVWNIPKYTSTVHSVEIN